MFNLIAILYHPVGTYSQSSYILSLAPLKPYRST